MSTESKPEEPIIEAVPYFDGERGWVAPEFSVPRQGHGKHNPHEGWILANEWPSVQYQPGTGGWVADGWEEGGAPPPKRSPREEIKGKRKSGKRGWTTSEWDDVNPNYGYDFNPKLPVPSSSKQYIASFNPHASITDTDPTVVVEIELPGVFPENISLELVSQTSQKIHFDATATRNESGAIIPRVAQPQEQPLCFLLVRGYKKARYNPQRVMDEREYGYFEKYLPVGRRISKDSQLMVTFEGGIFTVFIAKTKALPPAENGTK